MLYRGRLYRDMSIYRYIVAALMYMYIYPTEDHVVYMYKSWYLVSQPLSDQLLSLPQSQPLSSQLLSLPRSQPPLYRKKNKTTKLLVNMKFELNVRIHV